MDVLRAYIKNIIKNIIKLSTYNYLIKLSTYNYIIKTSTYNYIIKTSTYKYLMNSIGCIVYRIRNIGLDCLVSLNKKLNNQIKHVKFYSNYFKYLDYFKQLFLNNCLIFIDIKF